MKKIFVFVMLLLSKPCFSQNIVIKGATVYPSPDAKPILNAEVIIRDGKITYVGKLSKITQSENGIVLDGKGLFLTAGFWNSHVHFLSPIWNGADTIPSSRLTRQLDKMINRWGFTHVFDVGELNFQNLKALRARIDKGEIPGPSIRAVGVPLVPKNGSPFYILPLKLPEVGDATAAAKQVTAQVNEGAQGIKLFLASPNGKEVVPMSLASAKAAVRTAHQYQLPVFAHPSTDAGVSLAIAADIDVLAHVAPDAHIQWNEALAKSLVRKKIALIPTLKMFKWSLVSNGGDTTKDQLMLTALQQLNIFWKAGGTVLFGTDIDYMTDYDTTEEFELMGRAGLHFSDILRSLTTAPAEKFGMRKTIGKVAEGYDGDIVLLNADPALDCRNFSKVLFTVAKGKIIYQDKQVRD